MSSKITVENTYNFSNAFKEKVIVAAIIISSFLISACQNTQIVDDDISSTEFLTDYSLLELVPGEQEKKYYLKPNVDWSKYHSIIIEQVIINQSSKDEYASMSRLDRLMMSIYFQNSMRMSVQKDIVVATIPEPGVLKVRASISDTKTGSTLGGMIGGGYGKVVIQGEIVDSITGEPLVAIIDYKRGEFLSAYTNWDDAAIALDNWSEQLHSVLKSHMGSSPTHPQKYQLATARRLSSNYSNSLANATSEEQEFIQMLNDNPTAMGGAIRKTLPVETNAPTDMASMQVAMLDSKAPKPSIKQILKAVPRQGTIVLPSPTAQLQPKVEPSLEKKEKKNKPQAVIVKSKPVAEKPAKPQKVASNKSKKEPKSTENIHTLFKEETVSKTEKKVEEYDPWKNANMGNAQLNGSKLRPFVLGLSEYGNLVKIVKATKKRLAKAGFEVIGEYSPYDKTTIIIVTNQIMKSHAARSKFGGYGAVIRVSVTQSKDKVQVSYTNPYYTSNIYRMKGDVSSVANVLTKTLGQKKVYGSSEGISANDLRDWHYMFGMPYFDDHIVLQEGKNYKDLVKNIEKNLANKKGGTKKVYRIDIPGKNESVFGVAITQGSGADKNVMENIDVANVKHSAHLPYEILVSNNKAYMLHGKFRIAISFPDLTMGEFMTISMAPGSTEDTMKSVTNN